MHSTLRGSLQMNRPVPDFSLPDQTGRIRRLSDYRGKITIVNFWSAECPWSERADQSLLKIVEQFPEQVALLPIASNLNESDGLIDGAICRRGIRFVLRDTGCGVAQAWQAQTTTQAFVIDSSNILRYRGAVDDVTFRKAAAPERFYVAEAVQALIDGRLPDVQETTPYGCAIVQIV